MKSLAVLREGFGYRPLDRWARIPIDQTEGLVVISLSYLGVLFQYAISARACVPGDVLVFRFDSRDPIAFQLRFWPVTGRPALSSSALSSSIPILVDPPEPRIIVQEKSCLSECSRARSKSPKVM
jgi:hypothetical protein